VSNVEPQELEALMDALRPGGAGSPEDVTTRDFRQPQRLSPREMFKLRQQLTESLGELRAALELTFRGRHALAIDEITEINCEGLFADLKPPMALLRFDVARQPCWVLWEAQAALTGIEIALGQDEVDSASPRAFTSVERIVLRRVLDTVASRVARAIGIAPEEGSVVEAAELIGSWRDGGAAADPQRLCVRLAFEGPGGTSRFAVYLPAPARSGSSPATPAAPAKALPLPAHLEEVPIDVSVCLGSTEVRLSDLLAIEAGDVIRLGARVGQPLTVVVEESSCMQAELGRSQGRLAARVTKFERPPAPAPKPAGPRADEKQR
jgi:flagellar motor switch protein FliM